MKLDRINLDNVNFEHKSFVIAIEGLDKSGKDTQQKRLLDKLITLGYRVDRLEYPKYSTVTGQLIKEKLTSTKKQTDSDKIMLELLMAANKHEDFSNFNFKEIFFNCDIIVIDRYLLSQIVYSEANGTDPELTEILARGLRRPDLEIVLDVSPEVSMERRGKHNNGVNDRYESDYQLLHKVRSLYQERQTASHKVMINAEQKVEDITEEIMQKIEKYLPEIQVNHV